MSRRRHGFEKPEVETVNCNRIVNRRLRHAGSTANDGGWSFESNRFSVITNRNQSPTSLNRARAGRQSKRIHASQHFQPWPGKMCEDVQTPVEKRRVVWYKWNLTCKAATGTARVRGGATDEPPLFLPRIGSCIRAWDGYGGSAHAKNYEIFALSVPWELKREHWSLLFPLGCSVSRRSRWLQSGWKEPGLQCTERWK